MSTRTLSGESAQQAASVTAHNGQARLSQAEARRIFARVQGATGSDALRALRFAAGTICPPIARLVATAATEAGRSLGVGPEALVVGSGEVGDGETVIRVRRQAHGVAGWITTETSDIKVELRVASKQGPPVRGRRTR